MRDFDTLTYNFIYYPNLEQNKKKPPSGFLVAALTLIVVSLSGILVLTAIAMLAPVNYEHPVAGSLTGISAYCYLHTGYYIILLLFLAAMLGGITMVLIIWAKNAKRSDFEF